MHTLLTTLAVLTGIFGLLVGAYLTTYKVKPVGKLNKIIIFTMTGVAVSVATFAITVTVIWPPVM